MKYTDLMIDIETLGTRPDAATVQIAARFFNQDGTKGPHISLRIEPDERASFSLSTISWWCTHDGAATARPIVFNPRAVRMTEKSACLLINEFIEKESDPQTVRIWGNGANFDPVIIESMYHRNNIAVPWKFWNIRCLRTLRALFPQIARSKPTTAHDALSDADAQIDSVIAVNKLLSAQDAWISVEDQMPEAWGPVIFFSSKMGVYEGFLGDSGWYIGRTKSKCTDVTHWQPLPARPILDKDVKK